MRRALRIPLLATAMVALVVVQTTPAAAAPPPALAVGTEIALTAARPGNHQSEVAVAWHGGMFFVVWQESAPAGTSQIYGARVRPDGTVLDPGGILLSARPDDNNVHPRVAGGDGRFLVVWQVDIEGTYGDLDAAVVTLGGGVQKQWGLSRGDNGQYAPDISWNGQLFLAVWQDEPDPSDQDIYGARILSSGLTLDGCSTDSCPNPNDVGIAIADGPGDQVQPIVTGTTDMFLVAWTDRSDPAQPTVRSTAVALNGWSFDRAGGPLNQGPGAQTQPAVGWNGSTALFAWSDVRGGSSDIRSTTMVPGDEANYSPELGQPNGVVVSNKPGNQTAPAVARRSSHFLVVWTDERSGNADVYGSRVGIGGAVLDANGVPVATGSRQQRDAAVASSGPKVLVGYQHDVPGGIDRVFFRIVS